MHLPSYHAFLSRPLVLFYLRAYLAAGLRLCVSGRLRGHRLARPTFPLMARLILVGFIFDTRSKPENTPQAWQTC